MQWGRELTQLSLELLQTRLGRVEGCGDAVSLGAEARVLFALVSIAVTSLLGFVFPLIATVSSRVLRSSPWPQAREGRWIAMQMIAEDRAIGDVMHPSSEREA